MKLAYQLFGLSLLLIWCSSLFSIEVSKSQSDYEANIVVVKFKPEYKAQILNYTQSSFGLTGLDGSMASLGSVKIDSRFHPNPKKYRADLPDLSLIYQIDYSKPMSPHAAAELLMQTKYFEYAEPSFICNELATPNDTYYPSSSYLTTLQAADAWEIQKGDSTEVILAIVDTGVRWTHLDLVGNIRQNLGEDADHDGSTIQASGSTWILDPGDLNDYDDDDNGYDDDLIGWDFELNSDHDEGNNPSDSDGHGTNVAGIADARTNNSIGTASIPWNVKLMPISCAYPNGGIVNGYRGVVYAAENGADVINCSWGSSGYAQADQDAIINAYGRGSVIIAAAGNGGNSDFFPLYPAAYSKVVGVAALLNSGVKASSSVSGNMVDVSAPCQGIITTAMSGSYYTITDANIYTSYASPIVAGVAALIKAAYPDSSNDQIVNRLIATCDNIDALNPSYVNRLGDGRINALSALTQVNPVVDQELRVSVISYEPTNDTNANMALERNEDFTFNMRIRNYTHGVSSDNVTISLVSNDASVTVLNGSFITSLPADGYIDLVNQFQCHVSNSAVSKYITFTLSISADKQVVYDDTRTITVLINAGGVLVWAGKTDSGYSGIKIRDALLSKGYYVTTGIDVSKFPLSFHGFSAVFLSFGMVSDVSNNVTRFSRISMVNAVKNYLLEGGRIYIEGSDAVGFDIGYYLPDVGDGLTGAQVLWPLLGIASSEDGSTNGINGLIGQPLSFTDGISFTSTTQTKLDYIDKFVPSETGVVAFNESGYGDVAIQNYGSYGQKSFIFSYCLGELVNGAAPNTRDSLIMRIMTDFTTVGNTMLMEIPVVTIVRSADTVALSWSAVSHAVSYRIETSDSPYGGFSLETTITQTSWDAPETYQQKYYRVIARTSGL